MKIEELKNFKHISEEELDRDSLVDISNIDIRCDLPPKERMEDVLEKMKNPFAFKIGKYVVKTTFEDETGCTIGDCVDAQCICDYQKKTILLQLRATVLSIRKK